MSTAQIDIAAARGEAGGDAPQMARREFGESERCHQWTAADVVERFGPIPMERLRNNVVYGTATEEDVIRLETQQFKSLNELIDGVLVEKAMGSYEGAVAFQIGLLIGNFVRGYRLGVVMGGDGMLRFSESRIYIPDVSFISRERFPEGRFPRDAAIASLIPDLAVEVLSRSNTAREMERKRVDYFARGVRRVWIVDPEAKTLSDYESAESARVYGEQDSFEAVPVLPGLVIRVADVFDVGV